MSDDEKELPAAERFAPTAGDFAIPLEVIADPRFIDLVHRRLRPEIVREHGVTSYLGELPHHLDPADWRTGFLEVHDGGPPPALREAMHECTPQALLRDLFRPEFSQQPIAFDFMDLALDPGGRAAMAELEAAKQREPLPPLPDVAELIREIQRERRAFLSTPWQPFLRDDQPRQAVMVAIEPSLTS